IAIAIAMTVGNVGPKYPDRNAQNANAVTIDTAPVPRLMMPEPRYVTRTAIAMPAMTAPPPRPSSAKRRMSFIGYPVPAPWTRVRGSLSSSGRGFPAVGRRQERADVLECEPSVVAEELRVVAADAGRLGVLAAGDDRRAEHQRAGERLHLGLDRVGRDRVRTDGVEPLAERERLGEPDQHPRIGDVVLLALGGQDLLVRRHRRVGDVGTERRGDRVVPQGPVAETLQHGAAEAHGAGEDLLVGDS